jgi:hypothetical protein
MVKKLQGVVALMAAAVVLLQAGVVGAAPPTATQACEAAKLTAAGKLEQCLAAERAKEVKGQVPKYTKCSDAFAKAFSKAETKAGPGVCPSEGDAGAIEALIDGCFADLSAALAGTPNSPCLPGRLVATGQTTCWDVNGSAIPCGGTGQDGDVQAGVPPSYTDNGDGTITDNSTGLMWAKKSDDGSIHDKDTTYTWQQAFSVHLAALNGGGFAGYTDWRLPNVRELQSILNYGQMSPSVSPHTFNACFTNCTVLNCSCTATSSYWSSTADVVMPSQAWIVNFNTVFMDRVDKANSLYVRAVRGGL